MTFKKYVSKCIAWVLIAIIGSMIAKPVSAQSNPVLPVPVWEWKGADQIIETPYHYKNTAYLVSSGEVASATKVWPVVVLTAVDVNSGKKKWSYTFYEKGTPYPLSTSPLVYGSDGAVYAMVNDVTGNKLFAVNASGKAKWIIQVPEADELYMMRDGTLLLIDRDKRDSSGKTANWVYSYNASGKQIGKKTIGDIYSVVDGQYIVSQVEFSAKDSKGAYQKIRADFYNSKLGHVFSYSFPARAYTDISEAVWTLDGGNVMFRVNIPEKGNQLVAVNAKGKAQWRLSIAGNADVESAKGGFAVFGSNELRFYNAKGGLVTKRKLVVQHEAPMFTLWKAADQKLLVRMNDRQLIVNPATLKTLYEFPLDTADVEYRYTGNGYLYRISESGSQISQFVL